MKRWITIVVFSFITCLVYGQTVENEEFDKLLKTELKHSVPEIDVNTLVMMEDVILIDSRSIDEFNTSHIKGAIHVDFINFSVDNLSNVSKRKAVVVYCAVGSRSERVSELLINAGYKQTFNLYGGLFEWCNQGLPMFDVKGEETTNIHGVTTDWAKWLTKGNVVFD